MNTRTNATLIPLFSAPKKDLFSAEKINLFTPSSANYSALKKYPILPPEGGRGGWGYSFSAPNNSTQRLKCFFSAEKRRSFSALL